MVHMDDLHRRHIVFACKDAHQRLCKQAIVIDDNEDVVGRTYGDCQARCALMGTIEALHTGDERRCYVVCWVRTQR
jgi:hypothetical protein